jgi:hypothetical protein
LSLDPDLVIVDEGTKLKNAFLINLLNHKIAIKEEIVVNLK